MDGNNAVGGGVVDETSIFGSKSGSDEDFGERSAQARDA